MEGGVIGSLVLTVIAMVMIVIVLSKPGYVHAQQQMGQNERDEEGAPFFMGVNVAGLYTSPA
jgi:hypothetical protein